MHSLSSDLQGMLTCYSQNEEMLTDQNKIISVKNQMEGWSGKEWVRGTLKHMAKLQHLIHLFLFFHECN